MGRDIFISYARGAAVEAEQTAVDTAVADRRAAPPRPEGAPETDSDLETGHVDKDAVLAWVQSVLEAPRQEPSSRVRRRLRVWSQLDAMGPGEDWFEAAVDAVEGSRRIVALITPDFFEEVGRVDAEADAAVKAYIEDRQIAVAEATPLLRSAGVTTVASLREASERIAREDRERLQKTVLRLLTAGWGDAASRARDFARIEAYDGRFETRIAPLLLLRPVIRRQDGRPRIESLSAAGAVPEPFLRRRPVEIVFPPHAAAAARLVAYETTYEATRQKLESAHRAKNRRGEIDEKTRRRIERDARRAAEREAEDRASEAQAAAESEARARLAPFVSRVFAEIEEDQEATRRRDAAERSRRRRDARAGAAAAAGLLGAAALAALAVAVTLRPAPQAPASVSAPTADLSVRSALAALEARVDQDAAARRSASATERAVALEALETVDRAVDALGAAGAAAATPDVGVMFDLYRVRTNPATGYTLGDPKWRITDFAARVQRCVNDALGQGQAGEGAAVGVDGLWGRRTQNALCWMMTRCGAGERGDGRAAFFGALDSCALAASASDQSTTRFNHAACGDLTGYRLDGGWTPACAAVEGYPR